MKERKLRVVRIQSWKPLYMRTHPRFILPLGIVEVQLGFSRLVHETVLTERFDANHDKARKLYCFEIGDEANE